MSTILRALEIANEVGTCWYRPFNGDIVVNPKDEPRSIIDRYFSTWSDMHVKDFYFEFSEDFMQHAWMCISIDDSGGLTLSVCYEEDVYDREIRRIDKLFDALKGILWSKN